MRTRYSLFVFLAALMAGLIFFSGSARAEAAPDWSLKDLDGKTVNLADFKGKIVVLNFWATWCPPCRAEIPDFISLEKEYSDKGVAVVGLSVDSIAPSEVATFVKKVGINYPILMSTDDAAQKYGKYGVSEGIPVTVIIRPDGTVADSHLGMVEKGYLEDQVKKLLPDLAKH
jgi:peroxiredoxin